MRKDLTPKRLLEQYLVGLVIVLVPFHAFVTVWLSTLVGHYVALRLWPEFLVLLLLGLIGFPVLRNWSERGIHRSSWLIKLTILCIVLVLVAGVVAYIRDEVSVKALAYGVLVDTRYLLWFIFAYFLARKSSWFEQHWRTLVFVPLVIVALFAVLQFFVLPADFLSQFGYKRGVTIPPIQTINQDTSTIRTQSFLRGPNQLGMYCMFGIAMVIAVLSRQKLNAKMRSIYLVGGLCVGVALVTTFSRSAWLGTIIVLFVASLEFFKRLPRKYLICLLAGGVLLLVFGYSRVQHLHGFQNAFLHSTTQSTAATDSNDGHIQGIQQGLEDIARNPLGDGPGTAGPASAYNTEAPPRISESQYLNIGQELGWFGLVLFLTLYTVVGVRLFLVSHTALGYGLFLSCIGIGVANIFMYGWFDDTLAFIWWGLAGFAAARIIPADRVESMRRSFINLNRAVSSSFDRWFVPKLARRDGMKDYVQHVVPPLVGEGMTVYDIGGGKRPFVGSEMAAPPKAKIVGVDIDSAELKRAPLGAYYKTIVADIGDSSGVQVRRYGRADLVICEAVLEHVRNNEQALKNIAALTKVGGQVALFVPARNAAFAIINRVLPEKLKRKILFSIFPESAHAQGFPAYYHKCTPSQFRQLCEKNNLEITLLRPYYQSTYFSFFFPAHVIWRVCQGITYLILRENAAESFTLVATKTQ